MKDGINLFVICSDLKAPSVKILVPTVLSKSTTLYVQVCINMVKFETVAGFPD